MHDPSNSSKPGLWQIVLTAVLTGALSYIVNYQASTWAYENQKRLAEEMRIRNLKEEAYARLVSLTTPYTQAIRNYYDVEITSMYYLDLFLLTKDPLDKEHSRSFEAQFLQLTGRLSDIEMEVIKALTQIRMSFRIDSMLDYRLNHYQLTQIEIQPIPVNEVKYFRQLDDWRTTQMNRIDSVITGFAKGKDGFVLLLESQLDSSQRLWVRGKVDLERKLN